MNRPKTTRRALGARPARRTHPIVAGAEPEADAPSPPRSRSAAQLVFVGARIPADMKRQLKVAAAVHGVSEQEVVQRALAAELAKMQRQGGSE